MNWINVFEIICYVITLLLVTDMIRKRNPNEWRLFLSAALAGFILELLAVRLTGIYHYSNEYFISIGAEPYQFPFFGGLMWGGLAVCAFRIAKKFQFNDFMTSLLSGWLIVSMDLLLDVAAIRLNGGFWVWEGRLITTDINHHMFMSVIWVNFLGYMFETPALVYLTLKSKKPEKKSVLQSFFSCVAVSMGGVIVVGAASKISLLLDELTQEWFSFAAFILIWLIVLLIFVFKLINLRDAFVFKGKKDWTLFIFWAAIYGYCLVSLVKLGIIQVLPLYGIFAVSLMLMTLTLSLLNEKR